MNTVSYSLEGRSTKKVVKHVYLTRELSRFFFLFLAVGLVLPSTGQHGLLSPKSLLLLLALGSTGLHCLISRRLRPRFIWLSLIGIVLLLGLSVEVAQFKVVRPFHTLGPMVDQFKMFIVTFLATCTMVYWGTVLNDGFQKILHTMLWANFVYCFLKTAFVVSVFIQIVNGMQLLKLAQIQVMTTGIIGGLSRFQTSADIPTPYLLFFALNSTAWGVNWTKRARNIYIVLALFTIFISYSRFLWAITAVFLVLHILSSITERAFVRGCVTAVLLVITLAPLGMFSGSQQVIYNRFLSGEVKQSDQVRSDQIEALFCQYEQHPFIGNGLGAYSDRCIRDSNNPHYYEVQWVAFFMQFGFLGSSLLILLLGSVLWPYMQPPLTWLKLTTSIVYIMWLLSGFTNPFLISLNSGFIYGLFLLAGWHLKPAHFRRSNTY